MQQSQTRSKTATAFTCNICGNFAEAPVTDFSRETGHCPSCNSMVRWRSIIHLLSIGLYGEPRILPDFTEDRRIRGLGMSDWEGYANPLARKFTFINTQYHTEPRLDITNPDPQYGGCDFILSSDVFEHVAQPVLKAFAGAFKLLKRGGFIVFSVPFKNDGGTIEHFPRLRKYKIVEENGKRVLYNKSSFFSKAERYDNLVFHGGAGETLEMRLFSKSGLVSNLQSVGFQKIEFLKGFPKHGIQFEGQWSLPLIARKI